MTTAVIIPSYKRPSALRSVAESLAAGTKAPYRLYFVLEADDQPSRAAASNLDATVILNPGPKTYASCINAAFRETEETFFFLGADDLRFKLGWLEAALDRMDDPGISVVGTADPLHEWPDQSTHYLVRRTYIQDHSGCVDIPNTVLYNYHHAYTDWEFVAVAKARGVYAYCAESRVEHLHPGWESDGRVNPNSDLFDETYAKGNTRHQDDRAEWIRRSSLWIDDFKRRETLSQPDRVMLQIIDEKTLAGRFEWRVRNVLRRVLPTSVRCAVYTLRTRIRRLRYGGSSRD